MTAVFVSRRGYAQPKSRGESRPRGARPAVAANPVAPGGTPVSLTATDKSSTISGVGHDDQRRELHVRFRGGDVTYVYEDVPAEMAAAMLAADSVGGFLHRAIVPKYRCRRAG